MCGYVFLVKNKSEIPIDPQVSFPAPTPLLPFPEVTTVTYFVNFLPELLLGVYIHRKKKVIFSFLSFFFFSVL